MDNLLWLPRPNGKKTKAIWKTKQNKAIPSQILPILYVLGPKNDVDEFQNMGFKIAITNI